MNDEELICTADEGQCTNVYVANLPPTADAPRIREFFADTGKILHVKLLLDIATGVSRGIAFVMFENLFTARRACLLKNKMVLDGSVLQVRLAERSSQHSSIEAHTRSTIVYLRNVPQTTTKDHVKAFCALTYGPVTDACLHPQSFELNGPSPFNMVFVTFEDVDDACRCVEGVDGKAPFPIPSGHPFTMAKMITDISGEMRKSILLRRRGDSAGQSSFTPKTSPQAHQQLQQQRYPQQVPSPSQSPNTISLAPPRRPDMIPMFNNVAFAQPQVVVQQQVPQPFSQSLPPTFHPAVFQHPRVGLVPQDEMRNQQIQTVPFSPQYVLVPISQVSQQMPSNMFTQYH